MRILIIPLVACSFLCTGSAALAQGKGKGKKEGPSETIDLIEYLMSFNKKKDGKLTKEELTDTRLHRLFDRADANKDGAVTKAELETLITAESKDLGPGKGPGGFGKDKGGFGKDKGGFGKDKGGFGKDKGGFGKDGPGKGEPGKGGPDKGSGGKDGPAKDPPPQPGVSLAPVQKRSHADTYSVSRGSLWMSTQPGSMASNAH